MARPTKAVKTMSKNLTKEEKTARIRNETKLKGSSDKIQPLDHLTKSQKLIFGYIVSELEAAGILGNLDVYILAQCSIAIDRLQTIETMINNDLELLSNSPFMASKDKYTKDLYRCCNELSLSPQSRAKMANINIQADTDAKDPLTNALAMIEGGAS